jgi:transcription-repair coupling factor (superfamily II helicase)
MSVLTPEARKRLRTLEEFSELGSGFNIAMRDLDIRGAGNLLGGEQSGFITDIGYETYQRILDEAVRELKEKEFQDLFREDLEKSLDFVRDVQVDTDVEMLIPDAYVTNIQERLNLYSRLDSLLSEEELEQYAKDLRDRFGPIPPQVEELFAGLRLRWECKKLGFERIILKGGKLRAYFVEDPQSLYFETRRFNNILQLITTEGKLRGLKLKQAARHLILIKEDVHTLSEATEVLLKILKKVEQMEASEVTG